MGTLRAWLEYNDERGMTRKLSLPDEGEATPAPGLLVFRQGPAFIVKETKAGLRLTLNGRSISKAKLKNLDTIQYGARIFIFHVNVVADPAAPNPAKAQVTPPPPRRKTMRRNAQLLFPWDMLFMPRPFWRKALAQPLTSVKGNALFIAIHLAALAWFPAMAPRISPVLVGAYLLLTGALFMVTYMCAALHFGFKKRGQLSEVLHFTFYAQPFILATQASHGTHPALPAAATALFLGWQAKEAFQSAPLRCASFGVLAAVPWSTFMTGVHYFLV